MLIEMQEHKRKPARKNLYRRSRRSLHITIAPNPASSQKKMSGRLKMSREFRNSATPLLKGTAEMYLPAYVKVQKTNWGSTPAISRNAQVNRYGNDMPIE